MGWESKKTLDGQSYYYNSDTEDITWTKPAELQTNEEKELARGEHVWVPHPRHLWQPGQKLSESSAGVTVKVQPNQKIVIPKSGLMNSTLTNGKEVKVPLWPLNRTYLRFQEDDLVMLDELNEGVIMHNFRKRYENDQLYTWCGASHSVLIAVNPYKMLPLYDAKQIELYRTKPPNTKFDPHVFDIANDAFNNLLFSHVNQSILISGESGAGKTVATKHCLQFLASVAGSESNVEERIVLANPILEAFGNAQTIRNNNSSRFGKWIQVYFDSAQRIITNAEIVNYLLEKSRLVSQQKGERNYHIFYQLTKNNVLGLDAPQKYSYTNVSGTFDAHLIDDNEDFQQVVNAMQQLGFSEEEKNFLFSVVAIVLNLGNCEFDAKGESNNVKGSKLKSSSKQNAAKSAELLGISEKDLVKILSYRSITVRGQTNVIPLDPVKARASCDSFAMGIYARMFDWLVQRVNTSLNEDIKTAKNTTRGFIGILDIFGFEIFEQNGFEQLCINFANEKLQQQFNTTTFKEEEQLYMDEEINFTHVEFIDNQVVCDLIEKTPKGLLPLLDDECIIPEGSDVKYMNKIEDAYKKHDKFQTDKHRKLDSSFNFEILHYAGLVRYNGANFMAKNTDSITPDQKDVMVKSKNGLVKTIFSGESGDGNIRSKKSMNKSKGQKSLSYQFRTQLQDLMTSLYKTESRYIRCVKPNQDQAPNDFISVLVNEQLRYSGVYEAVEIRRQGFPFRLNYEQFVCRYSCINMQPDGRVARYNSRDPRAVCEEILSKNRFDFDVVFGKTKCLYKTEAHRLLTLLRELNLAKLIPMAQSVMRGHLAREMRRRCLRADAGIQQALNVGNDIDLLDQALASIEDTLGSVAKLFPGVEPSLKKIALERRMALLRWKELEAEFEQLVKSTGGESDYNTLDGLVKEAEQILDTPRTQKQKDLFEEAVDHRNALYIQLQNQRLESGNFSTLQSFANLRSPDDFVKKLMLGKGSAKEKMVVFNKKLPTSLTKLGDDAEVIKSVKAIFNAIKEYAGMKKSKMEQPQMIKMIFDFAKQSQNHRDEVWCQLLKMTSQCDNEMFASRFWELIAMAIFVIAPSKALEDFVVFKLREAPQGQSQNFLSAFHAVKFDGLGKSDPDSMMPQQVSGHKRNRYSTRLG